MVILIVTQPPLPPLKIPTGHRPPPLKPPEDLETSEVSSDQNFISLDSSTTELYSSGLKKCPKINLGTKHKPMKVCSTTKKIKGVDNQGNLVDESVLDENIESPNVEKVPLKDEDRNSWLEFKKLAEGMPEVTIINHKTLTTCWEFINVDHPFVSVVRDFATNAFNEVVHMYGRYRKSNSMTHSEVISCKYINMHNNYYFNMTMEAIEEGVLEVYEIIVACDLINGSTTLVKKNSVHSTPPTGKIAMLLHHLSSLKSEYKTWKAEKKDIEIKLGRARKSMKKGTDNQKAATKLINLKKRHKAIEGKCDLLYREIESQIPEGWSKRSDPRDIVSRGWWTKSDTYRTGLIENGWVYNYQVRSMAFPLYALFW